MTKERRLRRRLKTAESDGEESGGRSLRERWICGSGQCGMDNAAPPGKGGQCGSGQCRSGEMRVKLSSIVMTGKESVL